MSPEIPDSGSDKRSGRRRGKKTDRKADLGAWGFAAFLLAVSLAAIIVGIHDAALGGAGLGVNALGAILAVVGAVLLVSAVLLFQLGRRSTWQGGSRPRCKPVVLVGFLLVILIGSYVALSSLRTASAQQPVVVAVALVLIGVAAGGLLTFRKETELNVPRLGAVALGLVGTLFAAWQFWYQNQYAPTRAGRAVALKVNLSRLGQKGDNDVIRADLDYEDIGGRSVSVLGSAYTLTGSRVIGCLRPSTVGRVRGIFDHPIPDPQRSFMTNAREERPGAVLAAGKFIGDGKRLDPNVAFRRSYVFFVPHGRYQLLRLRAELFAISASVQLAQQTELRFPPLPGDHELYGLWPVEDDSWLHDLMFGRERWVVLRYELVNVKRRATTTRVSPDLRVTARFPNPTWSGGRPDKALIERLFTTTEPSDSSEPFADGELAIEPLAHANPGERRALACRGKSGAGG